MQLLTDGSENYDKLKYPAVSGLQDILFALVSAVVRCYFAM